MNICMCGAGATYPHDKDCPWPYYGYAAAMARKWLEDRETLWVLPCECCGNMAQVSRDYFLDPKPICCLTCHNGGEYAVDE